MRTKYLSKLQEKGHGNKLIITNEDDPSTCLPCDSNSRGFAQQLHHSFILHNFLLLLSLPLQWQLPGVLLWQVLLPQDAGQVPELQCIVCGTRHQQCVVLGKAISQSVRAGIYVLFS